MNNILSKKANSKSFDIVYTNINILYYSFIFSLISSHIISDKFNNKKEQNKFIIESTVLIFSLCEMELDRLL